MKSLLPIFALFLSFSLLACNPAEPDNGKDNLETTSEPSLIVEEEKNTAKKEVGMDRLITFYGATICSMADPSFWEGFFGEDGENGWVDATTPEGEAKANAEAQAYYQKFGFSSEAEVAAELEKYRGRAALVEGVALKVQELCPGLLDEASMAEILENLK